MDGCTHACAACLPAPVQGMAGPVQRRACQRKQRPILQVGWPAASRGLSGSCGGVVLAPPPFQSAHADDPPPSPHPTTHPHMQNLTTTSLVCPASRHQIASKAVLISLSMSTAVVLHMHARRWSDGSPTDYVMPGTAPQLNGANVAFGMDSLGSGLMVAGAEALRVSAVHCTLTHACMHGPRLWGTSLALPSKAVAIMFWAEQCFVVVNARCSAALRGKEAAYTHALLCTAAMSTMPCSAATAPAYGGLVVVVAMPQAASAANDTLCAALNANDQVVPVRCSTPLAFICKSECVRALIHGSAAAAAAVGR